eukprot:1245743-Pleurochrysis_carterae.AAC.1
MCADCRDDRLADDLGSWSPKVHRPRVDRQAACQESACWCECTVALREIVGAVLEHVALCAVPRLPLPTAPRLRSAGAGRAHLAATMQVPARKLSSARVGGSS